MLEVENEFELVSVLERLQKMTINYCPFYEPDLGGELTAISLMPGEEAKKFCSNFKLAKFCSCGVSDSTSISKIEGEGLNPSGGTMSISRGDMRVRSIGVE
jgi:hypothetical protein